MEKTMNKTQLLSAILGILVVLAGALYTKGYFKTWEDYRPLIVEDSGSECVADLIIEIATDMRCKPWLDPKSSIDGCMDDQGIEEEVIKTKIMLGVVMCAIGGAFDAIPGNEEENNEDSYDI